MSDTLPANGALTAEQVTGEMQRRASAGLPTEGPDVDALYKRIAGGERKVSLDGGAFGDTRNIVLRVDEAKSAPAGGPLTHDEVRADVERVMTDPTHPMHEGYKAGTQAASDYIEAQYRRIPDADKKVTISGGEIVIDDGQAESDSLRGAVDTALAERGVDVSGVKAGGEWLFNGKQGEALLEALEAPLVGLAPQAEVQAHVAFAEFIADLNRLRREPPPGDGPSGDAFQSSLDAALAERGVSRDALVEMERFVFADKRFTDYRQSPAYGHLVKQLDSLPARAKLAAYARAADALITLQRLQQAVA